VGTNTGERRVQVPEEIPVECPYCGEGVELTVDQTGGEHQIYVEDCPICCSPWQVEVDGSGGVWSATLRTADE
jgi:hypothetical protein